MVLTFIVAPSASAWTSDINNARKGFESRRWADESYTEVNFRGCNSRSDHSVTIEIGRVINNWPDDYYGKKDFNACFDGGTSTGVEYDLPKDDYYFRVIAIDGERNDLTNLLDVEYVNVDTTLAD
jgi:hypothetical protein